MWYEKTYCRVAIIGNGGSGKSTLAQKLSTMLELPIHHLDKYFWQPSWVRPDPAEYKKYMMRCVTKMHGL